MLYLNDFFNVFSCSPENEEETKEKTEDDDKDIEKDVDPKGFDYFL